MVQPMCESGALLGEPQTGLNRSRERGIYDFNFCHPRHRVRPGEIRRREQHKQKNRVAIKLLSGIGLRGDLCQHGDVLSTSARVAGLSQKARDFHARVAALRKLPGNCSRCGKPNKSEYRTCDPCRGYQKKYKSKVKQNPVVVDQTALDVLTRRIASVEHELARMQVDARHRYLCGYRAGQRHERKRRDAYEPPTMSKQEAASMNHAYRRYTKPVVPFCR